MPKSWYIDPRLTPDPHTEQFRKGIALVTEQIQDVPSSDLMDALTTDEDHPLLLHLQKAVQAAVGAEDFFALQIVVSAIEDELGMRGVLQ